MHDRLQLHMLIATLPPWHQMQHMHAVRSLPILLALFTRQLHLQYAEHGQPRRLVAQSDETGVEVDAVAER